MKNEPNGLQEDTLGHPMSNQDIPNASQVQQSIVKETRRRPESVQGPPKRQQRFWKWAPGHLKLNHTEPTVHPRIQESNYRLEVGGRGEAYKLIWFNIVLRKI